MTTRSRIGVPAMLLGSMLSPTAEAAAQTGVRGVPVNRADQNPIRRPPRGSPLAGLVTARDPQAAIAPFRLTAVTVTGSTIDARILAAAYRPFVGTQTDNARLNAITTAIASAYAKSDVALYTVLVPPQDFAAGALRISVLEGYVAGIEIRGRLRRGRVRLLRDYLLRLERERPLHTATLQRVVSLIRDIPGLTPVIEFQQSATPGGVTLVIKATEHIVQVGAGLNNRGTALLGRTQAQNDVFVNGIIAGGDQLHATIVYPIPIDRFQYYALSYSTPFGTDGTTVTTTSSYLRTRPATVPLTGDAVTLGLQVSRPLIRNYSRSLYATIGIDGIDSNNALLGYRISNDRVRTLRTGLSYANISAGNQLTVGATASFGLGLLGERLASGQADRHFSKLNLKIADSVQVGKAMTLRLAGFGQTTGSDLPSSEQVALGGDEFGRAYESALIVGDTGYAASAELALRSQHLPKALAGSEAFIFSDGGRVFYRSRLGAASRATGLASIGAGLRLQLWAKSILQIEATRGLANPVPYEQGRKTRVLFGIRTIF